MRIVATLVSSICILASGAILAAPSGRSFRGICTYDRSRMPTYDIYLRCDGISIEAKENSVLSVRFLDRNVSTAEFTGAADLEATNGRFRVSYFRLPSHAASKATHGECNINRKGDKLSSVECSAYAGTMRYFGRWHITP